MSKNPLNDLGSSLGEYLREQRTSAKLSLRQLSELAGVSNPYLSQVERGVHQPSVRVLRGIAEALNVSAETLLVQAGILLVRRRRLVIEPGSLVRSGGGVIVHGIMGALR